MLPQPGALPVWALNGRPSASADASRVAEILKIRAMTPLERIERAVLLGVQARAVAAQLGKKKAPR